MRIFNLVLALLLLLSSSGLFSECRTKIYYGPELAALQDIFGAWNTSTPDINVNLAGWSSSQPYPCFIGKFWKGVLCSECLKNPGDPENSNITVVIISISLTNASIVGTLPPAIGNLTNLLELTLTNNPGLSGTLPKEIRNITGLTILNLSNNNFSGSIPEELFMNEDPFLQQLDLSGNQFTGQIPNLGAAYQLNTVKLSQNQLSGPSPPFYNEFAGFGFVNLTKLLTIDLSKNSLTGSPPDFSAISTLQYANFSGNNFGSLTFHTSISNISSNLQVLDLSQNKLNGSLPELSTFSSTLQQLDLSNNTFEPMEVPPWISNLTQLQKLSLKAIGLFGSFPYYLTSQLTKLEILELDNNNFNGTLHIDDVANLKRKELNGDKVLYTGNLQILSIMFNDIMNVDDYSSSDITNITTIFMLQNNPFCSNQQTNAQRCYCNQICIILPDIGKRNVGKVIAITVPIIVVLIGLAIAMSCWLFWLLSKSKQKNHELLQALQIFRGLEVQPTIITYDKLKAATNNFQLELGGGAFGKVYKGKLDGEDVAVKKLLETMSHSSLNEFINEVALINSVPNHENLVRLLGCCYAISRERFLVYEYVENNDLYETLFGGKEEQHIFMTWSQRFNIICGVARGLCHLHGNQPQILHRDIKSKNILLDRNLQAKIADFGTIFEFPIERTHITVTKNIGTFGYRAPEYAHDYQLTDKVDVYSFGVVVLELITGTKCIVKKQFSSNFDNVYIVDRVRAWHDKSKSMKYLVDPKLELNDTEVDEVRRVVNIALCCVRTEPKQRYPMNFVLDCLERRSEMEAEPKMNKKPKNMYIDPSQPLLMGSGSSTNEITSDTLYHSSRDIELELPLRIALD